MKHEFDCVCNVRDLGGLKSKDGRSVVPLKLFRSDVFREMSRTDIIKFKELEIKDVIDFRSTMEAEKHKEDEVDGVNYYHIPAFKEDDMHRFDIHGLLRGEASNEIMKKLKDFLMEGYQTLPFHNDAYQKVFDLMLTTKDGILFHCSAGKDRTGVMAALILMLLGVDKKQIYEDFLLSNQERREVNQKMLEHLDVKDDIKPSIRYALEVHKECLDATFEEIGKKYETMEAFFMQEYHLDKQKIVQLRNKYLV